MNKVIDFARPIALYLMIIISGGYAGLHFSGILDPSDFGFINAKGDMMSATAWAANWQIVDGFMRVRMGVFGPMILWGYVLTLLLFVRQWRNIVFWLILIGFLLFIADLILTINYQIPINRYIEKLDFQHLNAEQTARLSTMHKQVIENFKGREFFSIISFLLVAATPFFWFRKKE